MTASKNITPTQKNRVAILKWTGIFCFWTVLGIFSASQNMLVLQQIGITTTWAESLQDSLLDWYTWGLLTLPISILVHRIGFDVSKWRRIVVIQIIASVIFSLVHLTVIASSHLVESALCGEYPGFFSKAIPQFNIRFHWDILIYFAIVGVLMAIEYYRKFRDKEVTAAHLETQLVSARLQALKMQMNPHFLFNTLHSVAALIRDKQNKVAVDIITELSELLRYTLKSEELQVVPLSQELEMLNRYIDIERLRFSDHVRISVNIDKNALDATIPNMIIQPLVENSIRHGMQPRLEKGKIDVVVGRENGHLRVTVENDGMNLPDGWSLEKNAGIGLRNTNLRLQQLYGEDQKFVIENIEGGGVRTTMVIPFELYS